MEEIYDEKNGQFFLAIMRRDLFFEKKCVANLTSIASKEWPNGQIMLARTKKITLKNGGPTQT